MDHLISALGLCCYHFIHIALHKIRLSRVEIDFGTVPVANRSINAINGPDYMDECMNMCTVID